MCGVYNNGKCCHFKRGKINPHEGRALSDLINMHRISSCTFFVGDDGSLMYSRWSCRKVSPRYFWSLDDFKIYKDGDLTAIEREQYKTGVVH